MKPFRENLLAYLALAAALAFAGITAAGLYAGFSTPAHAQSVDPEVEKRCAAEGGCYLITAKDLAQLDAYVQSLKAKCQATW